MPKVVELFSCPLREYRSHSSKVGSACGDRKALANFFTLTTGVLGFSLEGDDTGDELLARLWPLRCSTGDIVELRASCLLSHMIRSFGDPCISSSTSPVGSLRSCHVNRVDGVVELSSLVLFTRGPASNGIGLFSRSSAWSLVSSPSRGRY